MLLFVVLVLALLAPIGVLPAMAEYETPMWVHRARLAYPGRSPHGPDTIVTYIHIRDTTQSMVPGATATASWTLPDGSVLQETRVTNAQGIAAFSLWAGFGTYSICVLDVVKEGWLYVPNRDRESCPVFTAP